MELVEVPEGVKLKEAKGLWEIKVVRRRLHTGELLAGRRKRNRRGEEEWGARGRNVLVGKEGWRRVEDEIADLFRSSFLSLRFVNSQLGRQLPRQVPRGRWKPEGVLQGYRYQYTLRAEGNPI